MSTSNNQITLAQLPTFLSVLPVAQFSQLPARCLHDEIARLDKLLDSYQDLINQQDSIAIVNSLQFCRERNTTRLQECIRLRSYLADKYTFNSHASLYIKKENSQ